MSSLEFLVSKSKVSVLLVDADRSFNSEVSMVMIVSSEICHQYHEESLPNCDATRN